jgi:hypothetical protein
MKKLSLNIKSSLVTLLSEKTKIFESLIIGVNLSVLEEVNQSQTALKFKTISLK